MHLQHFRDHAIEYFDGLLRVRIADFVSSDSLQLRSRAAPGFDPAECELFLLFGTAEILSFSEVRSNAVTCIISDSRNLLRACAVSSNLENLLR